MGAILERVDRQERTGATWRDLESSQVKSRMSEHIVVDLINQDSSVGEFLDPTTWVMASVRLPWDHNGRISQFESLVLTVSGLPCIVWQLMKIVV